MPQPIPPDEVLRGSRSERAAASVAARLPAFAGLLIAAALAAATAFAFEYRSQLEWVRHTYEVEHELSRFLATLQDAQLAQHGFLLTGEEPLLVPYDAARADATARLAAIARLTSTVPSQQASVARLRALTDRRLDALSESIALWGAGERAAAMDIVRSDESRRTIAAIQVGVAEMEARQEALLRDRTRSLSATGTYVLAASLLAILLASAAFVIWLRDRVASARALQIALAESVASLDSLRSSRAEVATGNAERGLLEGQVRQMQKMEAVGQLTGGIAHDFNNMLAVIMSAVSLTRKRLAAGNTDIGPFLDAAMDGASRAAALTARLLAFSRQQPLAPQPLDAGKFVAGMADLLQRSLGENIRVETVLGGGLWRMHADASELENAVLNLAVNARDAMPDGGPLTVETANVALDDSYVRDHVGVTEGQYVMIAVTDSGEGMTPEVMERAFDPFYTTKPIGSGTGLGLSQVFGFVKQSGGHVEIYSEVGQGTTVKIYLPRYFGDMQPPRRAPSPLRARAEAETCEVVLVVEDEPRLRELTATGLRDLGYSIIVAAGGAEALDLLGAHPEIECLFTDIMMPDMTGRQLAEEAVRRRPDLKILFTTGYTRNGVIHNGVLDPGVNFLAKPFTMDELERKVRAVLDAPPATVLPVEPAAPA